MTPPRAAEPTVSVIIPTYNRPDFLSRALGSLCAQTLKTFEVVVINDAGEAIEPLLASFADRLTITYVRHGTNRDRSAARNSGLGVARGRYIAYLDDDDAYRPDHLEVLVGALSTTGHRVAYSQAIWIVEQKTPTGWTATSGRYEPHPEWNRDRLMVCNYIPILSIVHERSCLDEVGRFDESLGTHEDWELLIRLAWKYPVLHVPKVTAEVSLREDGSSTTSAKRPDFNRTLRIVHARYRHLVEGRPDILAAQAQAAGDAPPPPPSIEPTLARARDLLASRDAAGAVRLISTELHHAAQSPDLLLLLAEAFTLAGDVRAATQTLTEAQRLHPAHAGIAAKVVALSSDRQRVA